MKHTRRQFLSTAALTGAFTLSPSLSRAASANGDLRVCVIGFRGRGGGLAMQVNGCRKAKLVALCDVDESVLDSFAAKLEEKSVKVAKFTDFRKACESPDIDAVVIATPNHLHALIAATAAANGKHAYVEKPVSHNVWEGRQLAFAAEKHGTIIQHGFQRRSETAWHEAYDFLNTGEIGKVTLAKGFCYKRRKSIGKVAAPKPAPDSVNYDLWCGPREVVPVRRERFHYDWHWQFDYGNGDLGNQGPHQLDVCRWMTGDPKLPVSAVSVGARLGYEDDGEWANTQICYYDAPVPILFEVRGLETPRKIANEIVCEGGSIVGGHGARCEVLDPKGDTVKTFSGRKSHMQSFVDSCHSGKIAASHGVENGHLSSALAHVGNISWRLGEAAKPAKILKTIDGSGTSEALSKMLAHLEKNGINPEKELLALGKPLTMDPDREIFTGAHSEEANAYLKGSYRKGFELPV